MPAKGLTPSLNQANTPAPNPGGGVWESNPSTGLAAGQHVLKTRQATRPAPPPDWGKAWMGG